MAENRTLKQELVKGIWAENPNLIVLLGMCPTLAITTSIRNGIAMGLAVIFVLLCSSTMISLVRKIIPGEVRIPCYIIIIATFVTVVDRALAAYFPAISKELGAFIPLIVVNCIVLGRAEAFASKNGALRSAVDALGCGVGFGLTLIILGAIREVLGSGTLLEIHVLPDAILPWMVMILPPGAFLTLGLLIALARWIELRRKAAVGSSV